MSNFRCNQQNLSMNESAPVCQHWSYASDHEMKVMLRSTYFLSAYDRLRPGDTIRIVQMKDKNIHARDNEVIAFANVTIIKSGKVNIDMHIDHNVKFGIIPETVDAAEEIGKGTVGGNEIESLKHAFSKLKDGVVSLTERVELAEKSGSGDGIASSIEDINKTVAEIQDTVGTVVAGYNELQSQVNRIEIPVPVADEAAEAPVVKWNPGLKVHEAVTGEGDDQKVLFSDKDKIKVTKWLEDIAGQKE